MRTSCLAVDISHGTMHDGPGIRTTVFLKGCPLSCAWCQNPECIAFGQEIWWEKRRCIGCGACRTICRNHALDMGKEGILIDRERCKTCGDCTEVCPAKALAPIGKEWTIGSLLQELLLNKPYYDQTGGGVTVSGGEPLMQWEFVAELLRECKEKGIGTAVDTCGYVSREAIDAVLPLVDYVLFDVKILDKELHTRYTGKSNELILKNLKWIAERLLRGQGAEQQLWIRTPLIPEASATPDNLAAIGSLLHTEIGDAVQKWELCAFNVACASKYEHLGRTWIYSGRSLLNRTEIEMLSKAALSSGFPKRKFFITGMIKD